MRHLHSSFVFLFAWILIITSAVEAGFKEGTLPEAVRAQVQDQRIERLRRGEILTEGGHLKKGAWGKMEGVIEAPPDVVWRLFIQPDNWKKFRLPNLKDSRAADEETVQKTGASDHVTDFYKALGAKVVDHAKDRKIGGLWVSYTFQYYDLPWPLANRWMILKNKNDETGHSGGIYRSQWEKAGGNVRTLEGSLLLTPFDGKRNLTLLEYRIQSDPGARVPKFLLRWGLKKTMPEAIKAIRRGAATVYRKPPPLLKTQ